MIQLTAEQMSCVSYKGNLQKNIVIRGAAGSGKSLVLQRRAVEFARNEYIPGRQNQIILFTYNNTLASYLSETFNSSEIISGKIEISTFDSYLTEVVKKIPGRPKGRPVEKKYRRGHMKAAIKNHQANHPDHRFHKLDVKFWLDEIDWIKDMNISTQDFNQYMNTPRTGRGGKVRMSDADRRVAFEIYQEYQNVLKSKYLFEYSDWYLFLSHNTALIPERCKFDHVLIDEAQDQSLTKMMILAALCRKDVSVSMDFNQRIYTRSWTMKQLGMTAHTKTLTVGFRCSPENDALAESLRMNNENADTDHDPPVCQHGPMPIVMILNNEAEEKKQVIKIAEKWKSKISNDTIAIIGPTNERVSVYGQWMSEAGINYELISSGGSFSVVKPGIKLSTYHSAKGLEFTHVILPDFNEGTIPRLSDTADPELIKDELEQWRNIAYVGITRAKRQLIILSFGKKSRFIYEMNRDLFEMYLNGKKVVNNARKTPAVKPKPTVTTSGNIYSDNQQHSYESFKNLDDVIAYLSQNKIRYGDNRNNNGSVWIYSKNKILWLEKFCELNGYEIKTIDNGFKSDSIMPSYIIRDNYSSYYDNDGTQKEEKKTVRKTPDYRKININDITEGTRLVHKSLGIGKIAMKAGPAANVLFANNKRMTFNVSDMVSSGEWYVIIPEKR